MANKTPHHSQSLSYAARAALPSCPPLNAYLLNLMTIKKTNLCVSADVTTSSELLNIAEEADIINDFTDRTYHELRAIASRKHFLIFEDRKFADIGSTVQKQYTSGPLQIAKWAEVVTVHVLPGPAIVTALKQAAAAAITAYNTTVHTEISAARDLNAEPYTDDDDDEDNEGEEQHTAVLGTKDTAANSPFGEFQHQRGSDSSFGVVGMDYSDRRLSERDVRKQSIVSISTTISTFSEPISPQPYQSCFPASGHLQSTSRDDALARLGPVPYLRSALLLAQMSSADNLLSPSYTASCLAIGRQHRDFVLGFIAQQSLNVAPEDNFLTLTPGVKLLAAGERAGDDLGQQYNSPAAVMGKGTDIVIVGRGILGAEDRVAAAQRYRQAAWDAYEARIQQ